MKRGTALILGALMILSLAACDKGEIGSPDTGKVKTEDAVNTIGLITGMGSTLEFDKDTYDTIISESHPVALLYYGDENKFPKLNSALEDYNKSEKEYQLNFIAENKDYAAECFSEEGEYFSPFESSVTSFVRRADTTVTSILYFGYEYTGGAHGNYYYYGKNYDTMSGKELVLSDVINDKDKLATAVSEQLGKHWSDIEFNESFDIAELLNDETAISWTFDYNGITIYFMPYSIASYASGIQIVTVSNEEYPDILKAEYRSIPSSYGVELAKDVPFYYDVTGDGKVDEIVFSAYEDDFDGNGGEISIYVNGTAYDEENWFYGAEATFIHNNGKNYIYVEVLRENDYRETVCYDLSYGVKKVGSVDGGLKRIFHEGEDNVITQDVLTNPESFYLGTTTQALSTAKGYKKYAVNEKGLPQSGDSWFVFEEEYAPEFTLLQNLDVDVYDKEGDRITSVRTLKAGEKVVYIGTDDEQYALLKCQDGTVCRVEYGFNDEEFCYMVNGINLEKVFDGVIFAG